MFSDEEKSNLNDRKIKSSSNKSFSIDENSLLSKISPPPPITHRKSTQFFHQKIVNQSINQYKLTLYPSKPNQLPKYHYMMFRSLFTWFIDSSFIHQKFSPPKQILTEQYTRNIILSFHQPKENEREEKRREVNKNIYFDSKLAKCRDPKTCRPL